MTTKNYAKIRNISKRQMEILFAVDKLLSNIMFYTNPDNFDFILEDGPDVRKHVVEIVLKNTKPMEGDYIDLLKRYDINVEEDMKYEKIYVDEQDFSMFSNDYRSSDRAYSNTPFPPDDSNVKTVMIYLYRLRIPKPFLDVNWDEMTLGEKP